MKHVKHFDVNIVNETVDFQSSEMNQLKTALENVLKTEKFTFDELKQFVVEYLDEYKRDYRIIDHTPPSKFEYQYKNG